MFYNIYDRIVFTDSKRNNFRLNYYNSLMINNDINTMTDTCIITIPYSNVVLNSAELTMKSVDGDDITISYGDKVKIQLNYYQTPEEKVELDAKGDDNIVYFLGFIKDFTVNNDLIEINCEDYMFEFKQIKINFSIPDKVKAKLVVQNIAALYGQVSLTNNVIDSDSEIDVKTVDSLLYKPDTLDYKTGATVFQRYKEDYKYSIYFRTVDNNKPTLYFGLKYPLENDSITQTPVKFSYGYDETRYPIIQNNLGYEHFNKDADLIIVGSYTDKKNKNKKTEIATIDGINILTKKKEIKLQVKNRKVRENINFFDSAVKGLDDLVLQTFNNYQSSGFKGSFSTFGTPKLEHGQIIDLKIDDGFGDSIIEQYYIDNVVTKIVPNTGFTQNVTIGSKL